jgi:hypothetical protein
LIREDGWLFLCGSFSSCQIGGLSLQELNMRPWFVAAVLSSRGAVRSLPWLYESWYFWDFVSLCESIRIRSASGKIFSHARFIRCAPVKIWACGLVVHAERFACCDLAVQPSHTRWKIIRQFQIGEYFPILHSI